MIKQNLQIDSFQIEVKALLRNQEGKILLLKHRPSDLWEVPGGSYFKGDSLLGSLRRDLLEQINFNSYNLEFQSFGLYLTEQRIEVRVDDDVGVIFAFFMTELHSDFVPVLNDSFIEYEWFSYTDAILNLQHYPWDFKIKLSSLL